jgi:hypothetical protein
LTDVFNGTVTSLGLV